MGSNIPFMESRNVAADRIREVRKNVSFDQHSSSMSDLSHGETVVLSTWALDLSYSLRVSGCRCLRWRFCFSELFLCTTVSERLGK